MSLILGLFLGSTAFLAFLTLLFRYEMRKGTRFCERVRSYADYFVIAGGRKMHRTFSYFIREIVFQSACYTFHLFCSSVLALIKACEEYVRHVMHRNKSIAETARKDHTQNIFDLIKAHKEDTALSHEEKRLHKEKILQGD